MHKESKESKSFLVEIEKFLYLSNPVRSTMIQAYVGKDSPSTWMLELSLRQEKGLIASLFRLDVLKVEVDVELTLEINIPDSNNYKTEGSVHGVKTEAKQDKACLVLDNFVSEEELQKFKQFSDGKISISCVLDLYYTGKKDQKMEKSLTFGTVEELHYVKIQPKLPFFERLIKSSQIFFEEFLQNLETDNCSNRLINLHV